MSHERIILHALQHADGPLDLGALQEITGAKALPVVRVLEELERQGRVRSRLEAGVTSWVAPAPSMPA